jgi:hypothetical protein
MSLVRCVAVAATLAVLGACGGDGGDGGSGGDGDGPRVRLNAAVASYDIAAGEPTRFLVGLFTSRNEGVTGGTVELGFSFLGTGGQSPEPAGSATATFLPIPGEEVDHEHPEAGPAAEGRGVYQAPDTVFDRAGFWVVEVTAEVDGEPLTAESTFEVVAEHRFPAVGDRAPRTENLVIGSDAPAGAVDSRELEEGEIPDPGLHDSTIAEAIAAGRPALVVLATPVFCVSQFCGPVTDMVEDLSEEYADRADFIHVEIWRDFQNKVVNESAAEWVLRGGSVLEPWVYLIGADGKIAARWDNVATPQEIEPVLQDLPPLD